MKTKEQTIEEILIRYLNNNPKAGKLWKGTYTQISISEHDLIELLTHAFNEGYCEGCCDCSPSV